MNLDDMTRPYVPARNLTTYLRLVCFAVSTRTNDPAMEQDFRLCMPLAYVPEIARQFPRYHYTVLGFCCTERTECFVSFRKAYHAQHIS